MCAGQPENDLNVDRSACHTAIKFSQLCIQHIVILVNINRSANDQYMSDLRSPRPYSSTGACGDLKAAKAAAQSLWCGSLA
ncbi:hypothetical protein E4U52_006067 [Claviceps spartinae]|nr:hypothetical protein E4U52_006067 [Claviceps spartinae]